MHECTDSIRPHEAKLLKLPRPSWVTSSLMVCHLVCSILGNTSPQRLLQDRQVILLAMCSCLGPLSFWWSYICRASHWGVQFWQIQLANTVISGLIREQNWSNLKSYFPPQKNTLGQNLSCRDWMQLESQPVWGGSFMCAWREVIGQLY